MSHSEKCGWVLKQAAHRDKIGELHVALTNCCTAQPSKPFVQRRALITLVHEYMVTSVSPPGKLCYPFQA